jgi:hypothetical protein
MKWRQPTHAKWVKVATLASGLDVQIARARLEAVGIPVLVRGAQLGIFGIFGGFTPPHLGPVPGGIDIHVPSPEVTRARDLLGDAG